MANDGDWKPNGRPQSTIARNFSASLHDVFGIDNNIGGLAQSVEQKKKAVDSQTKELEALEARLRETEERLKHSRANSPAGRNNGTSSPHRRQPLGDTFAGVENNRLQAANATPLRTQASQQASDSSGNYISPSRSTWAPERQESRQGSTAYRKPVGQSGAPQYEGQSF